MSGTGNSIRIVFRPSGSSQSIFGVPIDYQPQDLDQLAACAEKFADLVTLFIENAEPLRDIGKDERDARKLVEAHQLPAPEAIGRCLYNWIRERNEPLAASLKQLDRDGRIILEFQAEPGQVEHSKLANAPWELLHDGGRFLTLDCGLMRRAQAEPQKLAVLNEPFPLPLNILAVTYSSSGARIGSEERMEIVAEALEEYSPYGDLARLYVADEDQLFTLTDDYVLPEQFAGVQFHVLHMLAHGAASLIDLEKVFSGEQLAGMWQNLFPDLRLVILDVCRSTQTDQLNGLRSISDAFLNIDVPAVVAMQHDISLTAAYEFSKGFYPGLVDGRSLNQAVRQGRRAIKSISGTVEWATPILSTSLDDPVLFNPLPPAQRLTRRQYLERLCPKSAPTDSGDLPLTLCHVNEDIRLRQEGDALELLQGWLAASRAQDSAAPNAAVLLGETGSAKTTLLQMLSRRLILGQADKEWGVVLKERANHPNTLMPLKLAMRHLSSSGDRFQLEALVVQAMTELLDAPGSPPAEDSSGTPTLGPPTLTQVRQWLDSNAWRFLLMLEGLEEVPRLERDEIGKRLRTLTKENPQHQFIFTLTPSAFLDFNRQLSQYPQWEIQPLPRAVVEEKLRQWQIKDQDQALITLLQQPWALMTLKALHEQGRTDFTQAALMRSRVEHLLTGLPFVNRVRLNQRTLRTLLRLAFEMEGRWRVDQSRPYLHVDQLFAVIREVRGARNYDLESLFIDLVDAAILEVDDQERVYFRSPHILAILTALEMDGRLQSDPAALAYLDVSNPRLEMALVLLSQLRQENVFLVVHELLAQLDLMPGMWPERLDVLTTAVHCLEHRQDAVDLATRRDLLWELGRIFSTKDDAKRLQKWFIAKPAEGTVDRLEKISLNAKNLRRSSLQAHAVELIAVFRDPWAFELLRCFAKEPQEWRDDGEPLELADKRHRRVAATALYNWYVEDLANGSPAELPHWQSDPDLQELLAAWAVAKGAAEGDTEKELDALIAQLQSCVEPWLCSLTALAIADIAFRRDGQHPRRDEIISALEAKFLSTADINTLWLIGECAIFLRQQDSGAQVDYAQPADASAVEAAANVFINVINQKANARTASGKELLERQEAAAYALGQFCAPQVIAPLTEALLRAKRQYRLAARMVHSLAVCCVAHPDNAAVPAAQAALTIVADPSNKWNAWPQREAISALGLIGDDETPRFLLNIIQTADARGIRAIVRAVAEALKRLQPREMTAALLQDELDRFVLDKQLDKAQRILQALSFIGTTQDDWFAQKRKTWPPETVNELGADVWRKALLTLQEHQPARPLPMFSGQELYRRADFETDRLTTDEFVFTLSRGLWELGYARELKFIDGRFTANTEQAVKKFKKHYPDLENDGFVDVRTWYRIFGPYAEQGRGGLDGQEAFTGGLPRTLKMGEEEMGSEEDVRLMQSCLWDLGYSDLLQAVDGIFGSATRRAVITWQRASGRPTTGEIDPAAWQTLQAQWQQEEELRVRPGRK